MLNYVRIRRRTAALVVMNLRQKTIAFYRDAVL